MRPGYQNLDQRQGYEMEEGQSVGALRGDLFAPGPSIPTAAHPQQHHHAPPSSHQVVMHSAEPCGLDRGRWEHQQNLDQFFTRIYEYHQKGGFLCIAVTEVLNLVQFLFIVGFSTFLLQCVDYQILFHNKYAKDQIPIPGIVPEKTTLYQAINTQCYAHLSFPIVLLLIAAALVWLWKLLRAAYQLFQAWEIRSFYLTALKIESSSLDNLTWNDVVVRLCEVQGEHRLCVNRPDLTELDVYQRILRHKNYLVALVNKGLLPPHLTLPFYGQVAYFPSGLQLNLELLLFRGHWSPWADYFSLRPAYKCRDSISVASLELQTATFWLGFANLLLAPLILAWQILHSAFTWSEQMKREPGALGTRAWSGYGRLYFRHFNELEHELGARLSRAYKPAAQYQDLFISRLGEVVARNLALVGGSIFSVIFLLGCWDEDVWQVEHMVTAMSVSGAVVLFCKAFIQDENLIFVPELLLNAVLAQVHYLPDSWKGLAHTDEVRFKFGQLFQFKAYFLLEELLSPIITPFVLMFNVRPQVPKIVDFFHRFTVDVPGLGDVCSLAQMDPQRHGDTRWQVEERGVRKGGPLGPRTEPPSEQGLKAGSGKTELSLLHFALANPAWAPPPAAADFLQRLRRAQDRDVQALAHAQGQVLDNPLLGSLHGLGVAAGPAGVSGMGMGVQFSRLGRPFSNNNRFYSNPAQAPAPLKGRGVRRAEGPSASVLRASETSGGGGLMDSLQASGLLQPSQQRSMGPMGSMWGGALRVPEGPVAEMSLHALYLHELHHRKLLRGELSGTNYGAISPDEEPSPVEEEREVEEGEEGTEVPPPDLWDVPQEEDNHSPRA